MSKASKDSRSEGARFGAEASGSGSKGSGGHSIQSECWHCGIQGHMMRHCPARKQGNPGQGGKSQSNSQAARVLLTGQSEPSQVSDQQHGAQHGSQQGCSKGRSKGRVLLGRVVLFFRARVCKQDCCRSVAIAAGACRASPGKICCCYWRIVCDSLEVTPNWWDFGL